MLNGGALLDTPAAWNAWPRNLPILLYHGDEDRVNDVKATVRFGDNVKAEDKRVELIKVCYLSKILGRLGWPGQTWLCNS